MSESSSRSAAKAAGVRFYQGAPCAIHPGAMRYVASKACAECAKAARKARQHLDTAKDRERKRVARAAARTASATPLHKSIICELVGI